MRGKTRNPKSETRNRRFWLGAIIALHLILGLVYWSHTAYGVSPDESSHGQYVWQLSVFHQLPVFTFYHGFNSYEAHQPPLYYALGIPFHVVARSLGAEVPAVGVRLLSLILGAISILTVFAAVKALLPDREHTALACAGFVAFLPMHLALSSSVGNDILMELVFGLAILLMTRRMVSGPSLRTSIMLGVVLGLGLLTKTTCILLFPAVALGYYLMMRRGTLTTRSAVREMSLVIGISLLIGGWWLVRNTMLYGDPLAMKVFNEAFAGTARPDYFVVERGLGWSGYFALVTGWTFASFWGIFAHMNVFMPTWIYLVLGVISLVALVGSVRSFVALRRESVGQRDALLVMMTVGALVLLSFIRFNVSFFQAQGRYLYPAIIPIALTFVLGIERLLPERNRRWSAVVVNGGMLLLTLAALMTTVIPSLPYQTP